MNSRRDRVKVVSARTLVWGERNRGRSPDGNKPETVRSSMWDDSYNTYENTGPAEFAIRAETGSQIILEQH